MISHTRSPGCRVDGLDWSEQWADKRHREDSCYCAQFLLFFSFSFSWWLFLLFLDRIYTNLQHCPTHLFFSPFFPHTFKEPPNDIALLGLLKILLAMVYVLLLLSKSKSSLWWANMSHKMYSCKWPQRGWLHKVLKLQVLRVQND